MPGNITHWSSDGEDFEDEAALARHLAARIEAADVAVRFMREGCMFRLTYQDEQHPLPTDPGLQKRTYRVELMTNSPNCSGGNRFTSEWPDGYHHRPGPVVAEEAADVMQIAGGAYSDCLGILTRIEHVMWPDPYAGP